jgi:hypothetical protein
MQCAFIVSVVRQAVRVTSDTGPGAERGSIQK